MNITYEEYKNLYGGSMIPSALFAPYAIKAKNYIDQITNYKADTAAEFENRIKLAMCAVAEACFTNEGRDGLTSESTSGLSQSYDTSLVNSAKLRAAKEYIGTTGLLYRGVD